MEMAELRAAGRRTGDLRASRLELLCGARQASAPRYLLIFRQRICAVFKNVIAAQG